MQKKTLNIIGSGGHGKVCAEIAELNGFSRVLFFSTEYGSLQSIGPWEIVGVPKIFSQPTFCAIGDNRKRKINTMSFIQVLSQPLIHPSAIISKYSSVGLGSIVAMNASVSSFCEIGKNVIVNTGCTIDHDCKVNDYAHISPGANIAGGVSIGELAWIGAGAVVKEGVRIGKGSIVGAGAVVLNNVPDGLCVAGNPTRKIR